MQEGEIESVCHHQSHFSTPGLVCQAFLHLCLVSPHIQRAAAWQPWSSKRWASRARSDAVTSLLLLLDTILALGLLLEFNPTSYACLGDLPLSL